MGRNEWDDGWDKPNHQPDPPLTPNPNAPVPPPLVPPVTPPVAPPVTPPVTPPAAPKPNYNGYAKPGAVRAAGTTTALNGWEQIKWADASHQSPKYVVGRILSNYADNPAGLTSAMGDIAAAYPGATLIDGGKSGKINIPGVGIIDVGVSFGSGGGRGWAWQEVQAAQPGTANTPPRTPPTTPAAVSGVQPYTPDASWPFTWTVNGIKRMPSQQEFDGAAYLAQNPDVAANWVGTPYSHFQQFGASEGRQPFMVASAAAPVTPATTPPVTPATTPAVTPAINAGGSTGTGADGGTNNGSGYQPISTDGYSDPATTELLRFISRYASQLTGYQTPQSTTDLMLALQRAVGTTQNSPETAALQELLKRAAGQYGTDPYGAGPKATIRAEALLGLQSSHDAAYELVAREMSARGIPMESGIAQDMLARVSDQYARNKAMVERGLSIDAINKVDSRDQAALQAAGESANVATAQQSQLLSLMKMIADTEGMDLATKQQYLDKALSLYAMPVSIADQRFNDAAAAANGVSANPSTLMQTLATIASNNAAVNSQNKQSSQAMWANIAKSIASIDWGKK